MNHGGHTMSMSTTPAPPTMDHGGHHHSTPVAEPQSHMGKGHGGMDMDHGMSMNFHFGYTETILFSFWKINSVAALIGSAIGVFLFAALYEGLKWFRLYLQQRQLTATRMARGRSADEALMGNGAGGGGGGAAATNGASVSSVTFGGRLSAHHATQTLLYMVQLLFAYMLMMVFMTFNVWLCAAIVLGAGWGHLLFAKRVQSESYLSDHCH